MSISPSLRYLPAIALGLCIPVSPLRAQGANALPANPATSGAASTPPATSERARHAQVSYVDGLLTVSATDAGLNGLIREIARQTGMHVSGSVSDLPVFGTYGPSKPSVILSTLLDGTGSNMLLVDATDSAPAQLTLTRRSGAPTPPNPNAARAEQSDDDADSLSRSQPPQPNSAGGPPPQPNNTGINSSQPTSTTQPVVFPSVGTTSTPATSTTTPSDPDQPASNGVKTPQQIFEQLQRMRQQQTQGTQTNQ